MGTDRAEVPTVVASPNEKRPVLRFLLTAYGLAYAGQFAIWLGGGLEGPLFPVLAPILMFSPAVAALVATRSEGAPFLRLLRLHPRLLPLGCAILVPAATALAAAFAISEWLGGHPTPWDVVPGGYAVPREGPFLWGGTQSLPMLLGNVVLTACWFSALAGLLAVGEEIGWRGYLQPRLCDRFGTIRGLVVLGLVWSFWHLPVLLMGYVFPEAPVLGAFLLFPVIVVANSLFFGWLRQATGGIWAAVLAHGSYNGFFSSLVFEMDFNEQTMAAYFIIVALTALAGLAFLPLLRSRDPLPDAS